MAEWVPTLSPADEARRLIADCTDETGKIWEPSLLKAITTLVRARNIYMERLGLLQPLRYRNVNVNERSGG